MAWRTGSSVFLLSAAATIVIAVALFVAYVSQISSEETSLTSDSDDNLGVNKELPTLEASAESQRSWLLSGRYYYIEDENCHGISHWRFSFLCNAVQAKALNRTYVIPSAICLATEHTRLPHVLWRPLRSYIDLDYLGR